MRNFLIVFLFSFYSGFAQYEINSVYGNLTDCDTLTQGIYIVWWDNNWDYSEDAQLLLDRMTEYRTACLTEFGMQDPPNPNDGYYYNVYLHRPDDLFPSGWGNGQGTDSNGYPYLTLPIGAHLDWGNVAHETFHVFQYSANSPGYAYSGDSQWYIEASANWFSALQNPGIDAAFLEAESLVRLPHVALWLSFDNFPSIYPENWQRYVHQYALALYLYYLSEETDIDDELITNGFFIGTDQLPQEYLFNEIGPTTFRGHFIDWAARMTNRFDFLPENQIQRFEQEWDTYADPEDSFEYVQEFTNEGTNGWYTPDIEVTPAAWAYNTFKINNSENETYSFELAADLTGTNNSDSFWQGKVLVKNTNGADTFYDLTMTDAQNGNLTLELSETDTEIYVILASMPETFTNVTQVFPYQINITKGVLGLEDFLNGNSDKVVVKRFDLLGREVNADFKGVQILLFDDGSVKKIFNQ